MSPVLFLDWGTRFQSSKIVILITSLQIVVLWYYDCGTLPRNQSFKLVPRLVTKL